MGHHTQFHPGVLLSKHLRFQDSVVIQKKEKKKKKNKQEAFKNSFMSHKKFITLSLCAEPVTETVSEFYYRGEKSGKYAGSNFMIYSTTI